MRILVTNDDGIDSLGLHALANAMRPFGEVTVIAPASEYSGAGASLGTLTFEDPVARKVKVDALEGMETWSITGPPALCVMHAQLGAFGDPYDLIVSGINPGQNVGWSVYHSGTIGAALTGRNRGTSGLAMSIGFDGEEVKGQTWPEIVAGMKWDTAATVASRIVEAMLAEPSSKPVVINCNVPNKAIEDLDGWSLAPVGTDPLRKLVASKLREDGTDDEGERFRLRMDWGTKGEAAEGTDAYLVRHNTVSMTWLGDLCETKPEPAHHDAVATRLDALFT